MISVAYDKIIEFIKHHTAALVNAIGQPRWGTVTSYDAANHLVKVTIQPEGLQTSGWLPLLCSWAGSGWGEVTPPNIGQQLKLIYENGDNNSPVAVGAAYSAVHPPPGCYNSFSHVHALAQAGERMFVSKGGAMMRLCADGSLYFYSSTAINLDGNVQVSQSLTVLGDITAIGTEPGSTGALTVAGEIRDLDGANGTLDILRQVYNAHGHPDVQPGSATTPPPNLVAS